MIFRNSWKRLLGSLVMAKPETTATCMQTQCPVSQSAEQAPN